jgi:hypothetical protein
VRFLVEPGGLVVHNFHYSQTPEKTDALGGTAASASFKGRFNVGTREFQGGSPSAVRTDGLAENGTPQALFTELLSPPLVLVGERFDFSLPLNPLRETLSVSPFVPPAMLGQLAT